MLAAVHYLLMGWYLAGPVLALGIAIWLGRRHKSRVPGVSWGVTMLTAGLLGAGLAGIYAAAVGGQMRVGQALLGAYFAAGMLFLLKGLDYTLRAITRTPHTPGSRRNGWREQGGFLLRVVVLFAIGLPYVMAAVMTYRPKVGLGQTPTMDYETTEFHAIDGVRLVGWWIPARPAPRDAPPDWGQHTLLICHGLAANKANHLPMGQWGPSKGYNVFIFDFRAHGESGGQLTTFGDRERYDVLGAVRWLRENRRDESRRIIGIGASMGAAALICAAADDSPQGQAIDTVVVYGTYARLGGLAHWMADQHFVAPINLLVRYLAVPMASAQVNAHLRRFEPAASVARIWPRPIMIVHGLRDEVIPFMQGEALRDAASQPMEFMAVPGAGHNDLIDRADVQAAVQRFIKVARPLPVI